MITVFNLDGTICDNSTREHLAREAAEARGADATRIWEEFHSKIPEDQPIYPVLDTLKALSFDGHKIEIWTARPERYRNLTEKWLDKYDVFPKQLLMRPDTDLRKSYILKLGWYLMSHSSGKPNIVFEDHPETVRLLRLAGAVVAQVGEGRHV
jgi:hypothetical protein